MESYISVINSFRQIHHLFKIFVSLALKILHFSQDNVYMLSFYHMLFISVKNGQHMARRQCIDILSIFNNKTCYIGIFKFYSYS